MGYGVNNTVQTPSLWDSIWGKSAGTQYLSNNGQAFSTAADASKASMDFLTNNPGLASSMAGKGLYTETKTDSSGIMGALGSDAMKGVNTVGGLAMSGLGIWNQMSAQKQAKKQWEAENDRANQVMAMNTERYNQWKTDRNRLNSEYV